MGGMFGRGESIRHVVWAQVVITVANGGFIYFRGGG